MHTSSAVVYSCAKKITGSKGKTKNSRVFHNLRSTERPIYEKNECWGQFHQIFGAKWYEFGVNG